ncbi:glycoside hydrolase family 19 protein, partial [Brachyspira intermedia]
MLNREQLIKIGIDEKWLEPLNNAFTKYHITDINEKAMFLAQTTHESNDYKRLEESFNYRPERLFEVFKKRVGTLENAQKLCNEGAKSIADFVYGGRLG